MMSIIEGQTYKNAYGATVAILGIDGNYVTYSINNTVYYCTKIESCISMLTFNEYKLA